MARPNDGFVNGQSNGFFSPLLGKNFNLPVVHVRHGGRFTLAVHAYITIEPRLRIHLITLPGAQSA
jgi:hypothetical protein